MRHKLTVPVAGWATLAILLAGCNSPTPAQSEPGLTPGEAAHAQVEAVEREFAKTLADRDFPAFQKHLAAEAIFFSGPEPLRGAAEVSGYWRRYFEGPQAPFSWQPDQVEVLASGELALSTGPVYDPNGKLIARFSSIWRQESRGTWRIVFDRGEPVAQQPSSAFERGSSLQATQDPGYAALVAGCKTPPATNARRGGGTVNAEAPPVPELPQPKAIPGVLAAGKAWKIVWAWEGNNADGPIAGNAGSLLFANNDASNVMELDPDTGLATILYDHTNTGGALSRGKNGALFLAVRGLGAGVEQLEPRRRKFVNSFQGEPLECAGGSVNDLMADARGGAYLAVSGAGVFYADPAGVLTRYGDVPRANGIILSPDEKTLYATNGGVVVSFDVRSDGSLSNQREFAKLRGGRGGDGAAIDADGRVYVSTGASVDVFTPRGAFLGSIAAPRGTHGVAFAGKDKKTLFAIVFYGGWGTPSARNMIVALPMLARGYAGRAK